MHLPKANKNETESQYIQRCMPLLENMQDSDANKIAFCVASFRKYDQSKSALLNVLDFSCCCNKYSDEYFFGFTEELTAENFYVPLDSDYATAEEVEYAESEVEEWDIASAKPGLWENIRKKKQRLGKNYKPAKPGQKDRPDPKAWKMAQSLLKKTISEYGEGQMQREQLMKMAEQLSEIEEYLDGIQFEEWTKDMISKAEIYIQNIYDFIEANKIETENEQEESEAVEYQGRKVKLGKPFRTPSGPKKFSVYVKNDKGNVVKVNFGDPNMEIKKDIPARRKSFRARMRCETPGPRWKARYWACKSW